jgi:predicted XRE-type DNA-binding protein
MTHTTAQQRIASNIRAEVARKRMTNAQIAELLGIEQTGVSRRMRGEVQWRATELVVLAEVLEVDPGVLLGTPATP